MKVNPLEKIRGYALLLLRFRPRTEMEMRDRLLRKGFGPETVESLLTEFKGKGLIDDAKFARYFAVQRMNAKPVGRRLLLSELKAKGVAPELASAALQQAVEEKPELEVAREAALARWGALKRLDPPAAQRRLYGFLSRRGFSSDVVYKVVRELTK